MADLVLTVIGDDRPGLVDALASAVNGAGGSWTRSHLSRLGGKFAGIAVVSIDPALFDPLEQRLEPIRGPGTYAIRMVSNRSMASAISAVAPAKLSRTVWVPSTVSKSTPGVSATPVRSRISAHHATELSVQRETSKYA